MNKKLLTTASLVALTVFVTDSAVAEQCYQDDQGRIAKRRRPGYVEVPCPVDGQPSTMGGIGDSGAAPGTEGEGGSLSTERNRAFERRVPNPASPIPRPIAEQYVESIPMPDRWRIVDVLGLTKKESSFMDPYNRNKLKADAPFYKDWFFSLTAISDTNFEARNIVIPVGIRGTSRPDVGQFGDDKQFMVIQNFIPELVLYKGNTTFKPPDYEFRFTPVLNVTYLDLQETNITRADPRRGTDRTTSHIGIQALFADKHLRNVSDRYDFDSFRIGIQPFNSDFRGFLFQDNQLGARLFGIRNNNIFQYNLAYFRRLEKETNSELNDLSQPLRKDDVFVANLYWQDLPVLGFTSQATVVHNRNREDKTYFDKNDLIRRPASLGLERLRDYDVTYFGLNGDGHFGRSNLTASFYYATGRESAGSFVNEEVDISAVFAALEYSMDFDWIRYRLSALYGSGDDDPFDKKSTGFDAILENPQFAGTDTSYLQRQGIPLVNGGIVTLSGRNGFLNSLRSSKIEGQSNFTNPGILLYGLGVDMDLMPELRLTFNFNDVRFDATEVLETQRNQGNIDEHLGYDLSASLTYRPGMIQNFVVRASYAYLLPGRGFDDLFPDESANYFLLNAVFTY